MFIEDWLTQFQYRNNARQTMVYAEFYHGLRLYLPQTMVKFCIYHGLEGVIPILT